MEDLLREVEQQQQQSLMNAASEQPMDTRQLLLGLYESAICYVDRAMKQIDSGDVEAEQLLDLGKAYWIIEHFIDSLDYDLSPELCADLEALYHSMMRRMTRAYNTMESKPLAPVLDALTELHTAWIEAVAISENQAIAHEA